MQFYARPKDPGEVILVGHNFQKLIGNIAIDTIVVTSYDSSGMAVPAMTTDSPIVDPSLSSRVLQIIREGTADQDYEIRFTITSNGLTWIESRMLRVRASKSR